MAALVVIALFWGNCFSCPQVLLTLTSHQPAHDCCKRTQKTTHSNCDSQSLSHFQKADAPDAAPVAVVVALIEPAGATPIGFVPSLPVLNVHALPDLLALHSSFRI
jgi:hypothetical protein